MLRKVSSLIAAAALAASALMSGRAQAAPITPGDLVIYRVGTGTGSLANTGNAIFLDEYTTAGALVQSIPVPTAASGSNQPMVASGTASSEGMINLSGDGQYVLFTGYNTTPGQSSSIVSSSANRGVGLLNVSTGAIDTSTSLNDYATGNNPRSVVSADGVNLIIAGAAGGIRTTTVGATTSTQINTATPNSVNVRGLTLTGGNVTYSTSSGSTFRIASLSGTSVGATTTELPGISSSTGSPYQMIYADLDGTPGVDTLYVADDTPGTIIKYSLESGTWVSKGSITATGVRGLAASVSGSTVTLYGTTGGSTATGGGSLYTFTDSTGYDQTVSGTATTLATLSSSSNEAFRGIVLTAPEPTSMALIGLGSTLLLVRRRKQA